MLIVGNWKMRYTDDLSILDSIAPNHNHTYIICPPFIFIETVKKAIQKHNNVHLGAQTVSDTEINTTGEVSAEMLIHYGCKYVIIGHSERKGKEDYMQQIYILQKFDIIPILCISSLCEKVLAHVPKNTIIAYEPLTAIGDGGIVPYTDQIDKIALSVKQAGFTTVLYGGSVNQHIKLPDSVDGVLVGRKSLPINDFFQLF